MLDLLHLPKSTPGNVDYFYNTGISAVYCWQTWEKPRGIIMLEIICIGAGGGGRSGWCVNSATRSGGGGGGSGGFTRLLIPAIFLPDVLYVTVGKGGAGGASTTLTGTANAGANGVGSVVSIAPGTDAFCFVCLATGGSGAVVGTASAGTAGVGGVVITQASCLMSGLGQFAALAGQSGTAGSTAAGTALTYPTTGLLLSGGGAGGGSSTGVGGNITAPTQTSFSLITTRTGGANALDGGNAADGLSLSQPLMSIGGAGGGASTNIILGGGGSGGRGGNGGLGCGGGGGGAGPSATGGTGSGAGGKGGDGLVIIRSW